MLFNQTWGRPVCRRLARAFDARLLPDEHWGLARNATTSDSKRLAKEVSVKAANDSRPIVLCLDRPVFDADVHQLRRRALHFNFVPVKFSAYTSFLTGHPFTEFAQTTFYQLMSSAPNAFANAVSVWERALDQISSNHEIAGFMTGNFDYYQDEPVRIVGKRHGIPVVALQREHPLSEGQINRTREHYKQFPYPDRGMWMLMGGNQSMIYPELGMVEPRRCIQTGFPRFDAYRETDADFHAARKIAGTPTVLLLDFSSGYEGLMPDRLFARTLHLLPQSTVVKAREPIDVERLRAAGVENQVLVGPFADIVGSFDVVVGYQSTALLEAALAQKTVVCLYESGTNEFVLPHRPDIRIFAVEGTDFSSGEGSGLSRSQTQLSQTWAVGRNRLTSCANMLMSETNHQLTVSRPQCGTSCAEKVGARLLLDRQRSWPTNSGYRP